MAVLEPTPRAIVNAAVSAKIGLFRSVRPANARSRNGIVPPHSRAVAALRILAPLSPSGFEFLRKRRLSEWGNCYPAQTRSRGCWRTTSRSRKSRRTSRVLGSGQPRIPLDVRFPRESLPSLEPCAAGLGLAIYNGRGSDIGRACALRCYADCWESLRREEPFLPR